MLQFLPGFINGPANSERRLALHELSQTTALPQLYVKGEFKGNLSTGPTGGILGMKKSGELDKILSKGKLRPLE